ncbi:transcription initiation factor IIB family protein [Halorubrum salinarum]|uniref:Transcription initiation factor IIB family protein n=1 Tax=Halorubrum salinarum TaxID=2739057 RepID=A0A7D4C1X7_9EURY|nr:transcription initiation factor IIB family protein [Halorubrum salinarum]QKG93516.1 transcription initiation factor IIB family protein [Halorubrum salinarum]
MTDSIEGFREEIEELLEDVNDADKLDNSHTTTKHNTDGWFREEFTFRDAHTDEFIIRCAASEIEQYATELNITGGADTMAEELFEQYLKASERQFVTELIAAATLYCACKINGVGISPTAIADIGPAVVTKKHLLRRSKKIVNTLGLDPSSFFDVGQYIDRYCEELELEPNIRKTAHELIENAEEKNVISGKAPTALAAGAVYWAAKKEGVKITQNDVAKVSDVSTISIRSRYQDLAELNN